MAIREAMGDANTVALVVHGVGDHTSVDILSAAERGAAALWGGKASTTRVQAKTAANQEIAASQAGMDAKTARKYLRLG